MKIYTLVCAAVLALTTSATAQAVSMRVSGTVASTNVSVGPWVAVGVGDAAVWEVQLDLPGTVVLPGLLSSSGAVAGTNSLTVGSMSDSTEGATFTFANCLPKDLMQAVCPLAGPAGVASQVLRLEDSTCQAFGSVNPALEIGAYPASVFDATNWTLVIGAETIEITPNLFEYVGATCPTAAVANFRNDMAGLNLPNFSANSPVLGGTWSLQVTNPTGGPYLGTAVVAYPQPLDVPLSFGSILVDISGGELLNLPPKVGQTGNWNVAVPNNLSLCGATFSAQGYGFAPGQLILYNAYDCVVGI